MLARIAGATVRLAGMLLALGLIRLGNWLMWRCRSRIAASPLALDFRRNHLAMVDGVLFAALREGRMSGVPPGVQ